VELLEGVLVGNTGDTALVKYGAGAMGDGDIG